MLKNDSHYLQPNKRLPEGSQELANRFRILDSPTGVSPK